jgi:energy-coupling factor transporter ATP-binding protein EcfA2
MKLTKFSVENFRSIDNSGTIEVAKLTSLVGRNESGKSNLLLALSTLNPPGQRKALVKIKDFPRGRRIEQCEESTPVVWTWWQLEVGETAQLRDLLPNNPDIKEVAIGRGYEPTLWIHINVERPTLDGKKIAGAFRRLKAVLPTKIEALDDPFKANCNAAWTVYDAASSEAGNHQAWATAIISATSGLRRQLGAANIMLDEAQDQVLAEIEEMARTVGTFDDAKKQAEAKVASWLPRFIYVSDFPELHGHQNLDRFANYRGQDAATKESEDNFAKLAKVADFDADFLQKNLNDYETRGQILNRASALVTGEIRRLWKDRKLAVSLSVDGPYLSVLVADENSDYPVEINLDERSRGFRWFFAFYITFSADTQGGDADGAILLLDEPGLYLHAKSQENLLKHLREDYRNQIIYTTHSPFMIPPDAIDIVRTVNIDPKAGTTVTNTPAGDSRTLFPLQAALGYHLSQTLFIGNNNLIIEGITDFWILSSVNAYFISQSKLGLPADLVLMPVGGAGKVSYMAALLSSQELKVLVLLDDDRAGRETFEDLVKNRLIKATEISFVTEAFDVPPKEADIEDLLDPQVYTALVKDTYKTELKGKNLAPNANVPRIVKRYEEAFAALGLTFNKTRPAREFMSRMTSDPTKMLPSEERFAKLFSVLMAKYAKLAVLP